jgi:hypothetical protein
VRIDVGPAPEECPVEVWLVQLSEIMIAKCGVYVKVNIALRVFYNSMKRHISHFGIRNGLVLLENHEEVVVALAVVCGDGNNFPTFAEHVFEIKLTGTVGLNDERRLQGRFPL